MLHSDNTLIQTRICTRVQLKPASFCRVPVVLRATGPTDFIFLCYVLLDWWYTLHSQRASTSRSSHTLLYTQHMCLIKIMLLRDVFRKCSTDWNEVRKPGYSGRHLFWTCQFACRKGWCFFFQHDWEQLSLFSSIHIICILIFSLDDKKEQADTLKENLHNSFHTDLQSTAFWNCEEKKTVFFDNLGHKIML